MSLKRCWRTNSSGDKDNIDEEEMKWDSRRVIKSICSQKPVLR